MAASLTITFNENKYQLMLQEKQNKHTFKRPASCRSVTSLGNSQNTGSTSTPRTIVFGSQTSAKPAYLGPFTENQFYPLAYIKGEKPTLHRTTKTTQHEPTCSYKPKIKSCITRPRQEPAKAYSLATQSFISTGDKLAKFKALLRQAEDRVQILSMSVFKEDKLSYCARGTTSFIAKAQPELTKAQVARRICRHAAYRQK
ncbi:hypothetical protein AAC387_Pa08g1319 [Persea americana]